MAAPVTQQRGWLHMGTGVSLADTALPGQGVCPITLARAEDMLKLKPPA